MVRREIGKVTLSLKRAELVGFERVKVVRICGGAESNCDKWVDGGQD